ncbi:Hydroxyacyl-coenzyme A dehydrogenase, mitochondrial [Strongyloides ratti]|uniref:Hydroxyacyl-coenzyme A dehydrogenase, mitochondrial n=1 Tax=Strongyloides ratti TaxID=34506 RepID=A0A090LPA2_STRRB|nr:Hydroxyacyl-coenzyme A dehydrogenase, mitochondrial [Strongyloides ratti]CEF70024.1 Hydroxyacyl-coenzyme A dehydrogenase, mitochondrial [Strongyloides ratti]
MVESVMGSGIGQVSAQAKYNVTIVDKNEASLNNSKIVISKSIERISKKKFNDNDHEKEIFKNDILDHIKFTTNLTYAVSDTDLIIEAIAEDINVKQKLFKNIEKNINDNTILATNTSSFSITKISEEIKNKENFIEIIVTDKTSNDTTQQIMNYGKKIEKVPVKSFKLYERNVATKEDIDRAMKLGAAYPMGPFELADFIGLDILKSIMENYPNQKSKILEKLVEEHKLGIKSSEGFYKY